MNAINSINPHRWNRLFNLLNQDYTLTHLLDRIIYRWQNSTYAHDAKQVFSESLDSLAAFADYPSTRALQRDLKRLEQLGFVSRKTRSLQKGRRCMFTLTDKITRLFPEREGRGPVFWQATNMERYHALKTILTRHHLTDRLYTFIFDALIYLCQRDANRVEKSLESHFAPLTQPQVARHCHVSLRTLQRHLTVLESAGLIHKNRQRISSHLVETSYRIDICVIDALRKAKAPNMLEYLTPYEIKPYTKFGGSSSTKSGGSNSNINIYKYNNTNNTCYAQNLTTANDALMVEVGNVNFEYAEKNGESQVNTSSIPTKPALDNIMPLDTNIEARTILNARQRGYIRGMMKKLETQQGCHFSDPNGLLEEIRYALQSVTNVFVGKTSFVHRVNIVAKLLRQKRWTTPHGYERYDQVGQTQKSKRDAREKSWSEKKGQLAQQGRPPYVLPTGEVRRTNNNVHRLADLPIPSRAARNSVPPAIRERLDTMKRLANRAKNPDCSPNAKTAIIQLLQQHQAAIKEQMA